MHYLVLVLVESANVTKQRVDVLLGPYNDNRLEHCGAHPSGFCWDWSRIGGRWDGYIGGNDTPCPSCERDWHHSYPTDHENIARNSTPVLRIREDVTVAAIVAPDGAWTSEHAWKLHGDVFWKWPEEEKKAEITRLEAEWRQKTIQLLAEHRNLIAVVVDCHD